MKYLVLLVLISTCLFFQTVSAEQAYIKLGEASSRKSNLAFPYFNNLGSNNTGAATSAAADIHANAHRNLELSSYFQMMSNSVFLEDPAKTSIKPAPTQADGFKFEPLKKVGAEFLIRTGYSIVGSDLTVEMFLYQVSQSKLIVGKRYKATIGQTRQIGHTLANDVIEALTGIRGPFMSKIVATSDRGAGQGKEVVTMNWDGTEIEQVSHHNSVALSANWSPDGKKIAYSVFSKFIKKDGSSLSNVSLYLLDLMTNKRVLTSYRPGVNSGAVFAPDAKSLYLGMSMGSGAADIYKINLNGEIVNRLTKGPAGAINVEPSVNPDGSKIAFSSERGGRPMIYTMSSDGGNVKRLTFQGVYNSSPSWSPDGKKIAFAGQDQDHFDVFVMNADGSNIVRVTSAKRGNGKGAHNEDPSFSPDSRYLVYTSNRSGKNQIYISTVDGSEERRVTNDSNNYYKPKWSKNLE
ncbi:MAG: PD40 domain-containing protein [Bdellovibrionaceae bacterium]|nr:PD40 domain-containing protein [Bdellovibrio sp.]